MTTDPAGSGNVSSEDPDAGTGTTAAENDIPIRHDWRFWAVFSTLCVTVLLSAVEATVTSTALPTIVSELGVADDYTWIVNGFLLTSTAAQPLFGQTADIFGRRWPTILSVALFTLGSGIAGGANDTATIIAGRLVQGIGGGGVNVLVEMIICDLVPMRERGKYLGMMFAVFSVGTALGPFVGGIIVTNTTWRWVFYLNLPIGGLSLVLLFAFLHVSHAKKYTIKEKIGRIDFIGNTILMASVVSILFGAAYGGSRYPWSSWRVVMPLVLGFLGMGAYQAFESSKYCVEPTTPTRLFANRTSAVAFFITFTHAMLAVWVIYFLPLYFQAVLGSTPARSGVQLLPTVLALVPFAAVGGILVSKTGRYRPIHLVGIGIATIGLGCFTLLNQESSTAVWVILQVVAAAGLGAVTPALLPAVQVSLPESDVATSTGTWAFIRSFGAIWGITIPAAVFNNQFDKLLYRIGDSSARGLLSNGQAYSRASRDFVGSFPETVRADIIGVYSDSLKLVWQVAIAFAGFAFFTIFIEKELKLRTTLETEFGLKDKGAQSSLEDKEVGQPAAPA